MSFRVSLEEIIPREGKRSIAIERFRQMVDEIGTLEFAAAVDDAVRATRKRIEREAAKAKTITPRSKA